MQCAIKDKVDTYVYVAVS